MCLPSAHNIYLPLKCSPATIAERPTEEQTDLVDLIHHTEGAAGDVLQSHEVHHGGHTPLTTALTVSVQHMEIVLIPKLNPYLHTILAEVLGVAKGLNTLVVMATKGRSLHPHALEGTLLQSSPSDERND